MINIEEPDFDWVITDNHAEVGKCMYVCVFIFESKRETDRPTEPEWGKDRDRGRHRIPRRLQALC